MSEDITTINFAFLIQFTGVVEVNDLRSALFRLKGRHRIFDVRSSFEVFSPDTPDTGPYPLRIISAPHSDNWENIAQVELARSFTIDEPRVRFVLLKQEIADQLLIVCDHNGIDGLSCIILLNDLLKLINHPELQLSPLPTPPAVWEVLPPCVTNSLSGRIRYNIISALLGMMLHKKVDKKNQIAPYQINSYEFSSSFTDEFTRRCHNEKTSVHTALCTAWLLSLKAETDKKTSSLSVSSPISLRGLLSPEFQNSCGMFFTTVISTIDSSIGQDFWETAREIKKQMTNAKKDPSFYDSVFGFKAMYQYFSSHISERNRRMTGMKIKYDFSITNVGRIDDTYLFQGDEPLLYSINAVFGPIVNSFPGEKTVGITTFGNKIRFVFTSFANEVSPSTANNMLKKTILILENAIAKG